MGNILDSSNVCLFNFEASSAASTANVGFTSHKYVRTLFQSWSQFLTTPWPFAKKAWESCMMDSCACGGNGKGLPWAVRSSDVSDRPDLTCFILFYFPQVGPGGFHILWLWNRIIDERAQKVMNGSRAMTVKSVVHFVLFSCTTGVWSANMTYKQGWLITPLLIIYMSWVKSGGPRTVTNVPPETYGRMSLFRTLRFHNSSKSVFFSHSFIRSLAFWELVKRPVQLSTEPFGIIRARVSATADIWHHPSDTSNMSLS